MPVEIKAREIRQTDTLQWISADQKENNYIPSFDAGVDGCIWPSVRFEQQFAADTSKLNVER